MEAEYDFITYEDNGNKISRKIDGDLRMNLNQIKNSVLNKDFDYLAIVCGVVGVGKSTFSQFICKYLDPTFTIKDRMCFTAMGEKGLIERTTNGKKGQAFILDESFCDLNTRVTRSSDFLAVINHLQLIRQKGLYIILCLPNFFDLSKGIAVFRASHLFVVYHSKFQRGFFGGFGRPEKRKLYVMGNKFMDYDCIQPNIRGRFPKKWIANFQLYERLKTKHLEEQTNSLMMTKKTKIKDNRDKLIVYLTQVMGVSITKITEITALNRSTIYTILKGK